MALPERFREATFENYDPQQPRARSSPSVVSGITRLDQSARRPTARPPRRARGGGRRWGRSRASLDRDGPDHPASRDPNRSAPRRRPATGPRASAGAARSAPASCWPTAGPHRSSTGRSRLWPAGRRSVHRRPHRPQPRWEGHRAGTAPSPQHSAKQSGGCRPIDPRGPRPRPQLRRPRRRLRHRSGKGARTPEPPLASPSATKGAGADADGRGVEAGPLGPGFPPPPLPAIAPLPPPPVPPSIEEAR